MRCFMSSVFCGREELLSDLFNLKIFYTQKELYKTLTKWKKKCKLTVHTFAHLHTHTFIIHSGCRPHFPVQNHV